jgi:hypothetical protein
MHSLSVGKNYCLRLVDGRPLGHVHITEKDEWWASGPFKPAPTFEEFRGLFEKEAEYRNDQIIPLWEETAEAIAALQIQVVAEGEPEAFSGLRVFVDGNEAFLGSPLPVS